MLVTIFWVIAGNEVLQIIQLMSYRAETLSGWRLSSLASERVSQFTLLGKNACTTGWITNDLHGGGHTQATIASSSKGNVDLDRGLYRYRHLIENAFARVAFRYDKLSAINYEVVVAGCGGLCCSMATHVKRQHP